MWTTKPTFEFLNSLVGTEDQDCVIWPFARSKVTGYGLFTSAELPRGAHRAMCAMVNGMPVDRKQMALHSCKNGRNGCVNPNHLRWGNGQENADDRAAMGNTLIGSKQPNSKLSEDDVRSMRYLHYEAGLTQKDIARMFGIAHSGANNAITGRGWKHVPMETLGTVIEARNQ